MVQAAITSLVSASVIGLAAGGELPRVFEPGGYARAQALAVESGRLLLVDATAVWCRPCTQMDRTTWVDDRVVRWIDEHAVAVQMDVDREKDRARQLRIEAMPTIIVFQGEQEFDRVVGYRSADELLAWLDGVLEGRREIDTLRKAAGDRAADGAVDIQARLKLARTLARNGERDEATEQFVWLWENMLDYEPSMVGVRLSFMVRDMKNLAAGHAAAREAFTALRDRLTPVLTAGSASRDQVVDWIRLNKVIGLEDTTISWYESVRDRPAAATMLRSAERDIYSLLAGKGRWADAGRVLHDPVARARQIIDLKTRSPEWMRQMPEAKRRMFRDMQVRRYRGDLVQLYVTCLAAGREDEAQGVASVLLEVDEDPVTYLELVQSAIMIKQPRPRHHQWLDAAEAAGEDSPELRAELNEALRSRL